MKNFLAAAALTAAVLSSCTPSGLERSLSTSSRRNHQSASSGRSEEKDSPAVPGIYLSGVEYPRDYDWQRDSACGSVTFNVVLFRGKERIITVPGGPEHEISPDPDMMRIREGHLYTDYSTPSETVIRRDGKELFRYSGRERIRGFLLRGSSVHTLGENRDGEGFTYRIDGKIVFERKSGTILGGEAIPFYEDGALNLDGGKVWFSYKTAKNVYLVGDGVEEAVPAEGEVLDQRRFEGQIYRIENREGYGAENPLLVRGEEYYVQYGGVSKRSAVSAWLVECGERIMAMGTFYWIGFGFQYAVWNTHDTQKVISTQLSRTYCRGGIIYSLLVEKSRAVISCGNEKNVIQGKFSHVYQCAGFMDGEFAVALSGASPLLWCDGEVTPIELNGPLTGLHVE